MPRDVIAPEALRDAVARTGFSPAIRAGDFLFLTGATGGIGDDMPSDPATQTRNALDKVQSILNAAGVDLDAICEITSYHVGLSDHFETVDTLFQEILGEPLPAWTAVEVAGLRRPGAVVEFRITAFAPS